MKKSRLFMFLFLALLLALATATAALAQGNKRTFTANLKGRNEVPANDSDAAGQAIVKFSKDNSSLSYKLIVANIDNVRVAHIHCAVEGENGPVGVTLYGGPTVTTNGILAQATVTAPDAGNACSWSSISDVREAIENGGAYVNVHSDEFPPGEIRGQLD